MKRVYLLVMVVCTSIGLLAQTSDEEFSAKMKEAQAIYETGKAMDALPLYQQLVKERPNDFVALERLGMCLLLSSSTVSDPEEVKRLRREARAAIVKARANGDKSNLSSLIMELPEDGSFTRLSDQAEVEKAMRLGETAYARGSYDEAIAHYGDALVLDPQNYLAALYTGDVLFKEKKFGEAEEWFARTIAINPNRETAYRYWGDSLKMQGKWDEAKAKFIEAVIAEPYSRAAWIGLSQWADAQKFTLVKPNIVARSSVEDTDKGAKITIDSSSLGSDKDDKSGAAWLMYSMNHLVWKNQGKFQKEYPNEKVYRHSLAEEMYAFSLMLDVVGETGKKKPKHVDAQLMKLQELHDRGLLESYILIHRSDDGIAQDYPGYRDAHRDKLREYLASCIVPK
jgi:tetratricopeptide (TPR) repeat protein